MNMNIVNLNNQIKGCKSCDGLNIEATQNTEATYNAPGYGDINSKIFIIGQSLCGAPCINSQIPFTGGCGVLLDKAFEKCGVSKKQLYITNIVKCHPPKNRPSKANEIKNCREHLEHELKLSSPEVIICLGDDARNHFDKKAKFQTNKEILLNNKKIKIYFLYHPQYIKKKKKLEENDYIKSISTIIQSCIA